jgi:hypothetical protein
MSPVTYPAAFLAANAMTTTTTQAWLSGTATTTIGNWTVGNWAGGPTLKTWHPANMAQVSKAPPREFNRYVNASDLVEEFIAWAGTQRVRKGEVLALPLESFIKWLIIRACEEDQEEPNVTLSLPTRQRCIACGRFMERNIQVALCRRVCAARHFARLQANKKRSALAGPKN